MDINLGSYGFIFLSVHVIFSGSFENRRLVLDANLTTVVISSM